MKYQVTTIVTDTATFIYEPVEVPDDTKSSAKATRRMDIWTDVFDNKEDAENFYERERGKSK